jgi:hypothetical protein
MRLQETQRKDYDIIRLFDKVCRFSIPPPPPKSAMLIHLNPVSGYKKEYNFGKFEKNHWYLSNERFLL